MPQPRDRASANALSKYWDSKEAFPWTLRSPSSGRTGVWSRAVRRPAPSLGVQSAKQRSSSPSSRTRCFARTSATASDRETE